MVLQVEEEWAWGWIQAHTMQGNAPSGAQQIGEKQPFTGSSTNLSKDVFCSNCGKKFSSSSMFCPQWRRRLSTLPKVRVPTMTKMLLAVLPVVHHLWY